MKQKIDLHVPCVILILIEIMKNTKYKMFIESLLYVNKKESLKQGCNDR
jgi:hypothetical protein